MTEPSSARMKFLRRRVTPRIDSIKRVINRDRNRVVSFSKPLVTLIVEIPNYKSNPVLIRSLFYTRGELRNFRFEKERSDMNSLLSQENAMATFSSISNSISSLIEASQPAPQAAMREPTQQPSRSQQFAQEPTPHRSRHSTPQPEQELATARKNQLAKRAMTRRVTPPSAIIKSQVTLISDPTQPIQEQGQSALVQLPVQPPLERELTRTNSNHKRAAMARVAPPLESGTFVLPQEHAGEMMMSRTSSQRSQRGMMAANSSRSSTKDDLGNNEINVVRGQRASATFSSQQQTERNMPRMNSNYKRGAVSRMLSSVGATPPSEPAQGSIFLPKQPNRERSMPRIPSQHPQRGKMKAPLPPKPAKECSDRSLSSTSSHEGYNMTDVNPQQPPSPNRNKERIMLRTSLTHTAQKSTKSLSTSYTNTTKDGLLNVPTSSWKASADTPKDNLSAFSWYVDQMKQPMSIL